MNTIQIKTIAALVLVLGSLLIWRSLSRRNSSMDSRIDLDDLLLGDDGKMSKAAVVMLGAFAVTTWMMVYLTLRDKMTEGYLGIYVAAWIAPTVTRLITSRPTETLAVSESSTTSTTRSVAPTGG